MRTENKDQAQQAPLSEGMRLIFDQGTSVSPRSRTGGSSSSSDSLCSSSDSSRTVTRRSRRHRYHHRSNGSSSSSSSSSRSRSHSRSRSRPRPRCHRDSYASRCRHRHLSRSYSPSPRRSSYRGCRRYSRSDSRSSSRGRYYRRSRRSRSRSASYGRLSGGFTGRFRYRSFPSPKRGYYRSRSRSTGHSVQLSQKDKLELLNIAKVNAAKLLGVEKVELPSSLRSTEQEERKPKSDTDGSTKVEPVPPKKPTQNKHLTEKLVNTGTTLLKPTFMFLIYLKKIDEDEANTDDRTFPAMSPTRKPIAFSVNNTVAKPSGSPTAQVESKVTSRADSVGNRKPYGQWIPIKSVSPKKR
ncbi:arginine/serine-rich protein 1 [Trichomycterus rosablanca]|uniref:arginine/serine-rich protein 1 n=1 Tax=Trichomycterus rosablanca TaxID=2290929 RepID=UPI002F357A66